MTLQRCQSCGALTKPADLTPTGCVRRSCQRRVCKCVYGWPQGAHQPGCAYEIERNIGKTISAAVSRWDKPPEDAVEAYLKERGVL